MRVATWNVNSLVARLARVEEWLADTSPDVLCMQETKVADAAFPILAFSALGYEVAFYGEGRWNGVAIASRVGLGEVTRGFAGQPPFDSADGEDVAAGGSGPSSAPAPALEARAVGATCGGLRVWSLYVPNGRAVDSPHYRYKLEWLAALRGALQEELAVGRPTMVVGDFNIAPGDADVWDPGAFAGSTHVTGPERAALGEILALGLTDVVPRAIKHDTPFTYWDYRAGMFHKNQGMRIDLVLANDPVTSAVTDAYVDREGRKGKGPSDHAPVVVDLDLRR